MSYTITLPWAGQWHPLSPLPELHHQGGFWPHGATSSPKSPHPSGGLLCLHRKELLHPLTLPPLRPPHPSPLWILQWPSAFLLQQAATQNPDAEKSCLMGLFVCLLQAYQLAGLKQVPAADGHLMTSRRLWQQCLTKKKKKNCQ